MLVHKLHVVHKPRVTSLTFTLTSFTSCAGVRFHLSQLSTVPHMNTMPALFCLLTNNVSECVCEVGIGG